MFFRFKFYLNLKIFLKSKKAFVKWTLRNPVVADEDAGDIEKEVHDSLVTNHHITSELLDTLDNMMYLLWFQGLSCSQLREVKEAYTFLLRRREHISINQEPSY